MNRTACATTHLRVLDSLYPAMELAERGRPGGGYCLLADSLREDARRLERELGTGHPFLAEFERGRQRLLETFVDSFFAAS